VVFEPVRVGTRDLIDGSLTEPVPVDAAREIGAGFVIAIDVAYRPHDERPGGITDMAFQMMHILVNTLIEEQIRRADFAIRLDVHRLMNGKWDASMLIDEGARAVREAWPRLRVKLGRT
jgi:NTE family protein